MPYFYHLLLWYLFINSFLICNEISILKLALYKFQRLGLCGGSHPILILWWAVGWIGDLERNWNNCHWLFFLQVLMWWFILKSSHSSIHDKKFQSEWRCGDLSLACRLCSLCMLSRSDCQGLRPKDRSDRARQCGAGLASPHRATQAIWSLWCLRRQPRSGPLLSKICPLKETLLFSALFWRLTKRFRSEVHSVISVLFIFSTPLD